MTNCIPFVLTQCWPCCCCCTCLCLLQMGWRGLISTSNQIVAPEVVVTSDEQLLWITEVQADAQAA